MRGSIKRGFELIEAWRDGIENESRGLILDWGAPHANSFPMGIVAVYYEVSYSPGVPTRQIVDLVMKAAAPYAKEARYFFIVEMSPGRDSSPFLFLQMYAHSSKS